VRPPPRRPAGRPKRSIPQGERIFPAVTGDSVAFEDEHLVVMTDESLSATLDGEAVLLQPDAGIYYGMNEVATMLWDRLEEPTTVADLREVLLAEFDVEESVVDRDLQAFIEDLESAGLVEIRDRDDAA